MLSGWLIWNWEHGLHNHSRQSNRSYIESETSNQRSWNNNKISRKYLFKGQYALHIQTNNGKDFCSKEFDKFAEKNNIEVIRCFPYLLEKFSIHMAPLLYKKAQSRARGKEVEARRYTSPRGKVLLEPATRSPCIQHTMHTEHCQLGKQPPGDCLYNPPTNSQGPAHPNLQKKNYWKIDKTLSPAWRV